MIIVKVNDKLSQFDSERLSEMFAKQIERGVIILGYGQEIVFEDDEAFTTEEDSPLVISENDSELDE